MNRVLALSLRPKRLSDLVGQEDLVSSFKSQLVSKRIPHFIIICGPVGSGKTTFARIVALSLQKVNSSSEKWNVDSNPEPDFDLTDTDWESYRKYDIQEINAANKNGVDDIRQLISLMGFKPMVRGSVKVAILDEAHQLTGPAQNALITETEDVQEHVYYIFCTSNIGKIIPALKRRAYVITPRPLNETSITNLLNEAKIAANYTKDVGELCETLMKFQVTSPGLVLQAAERYFSGLSNMESVSFSLNNANNIDIPGICRSILSGDWKNITPVLSTVTKGDIYMLRYSILGYLKVVLLKELNPVKLHIVARAMDNLLHMDLDESVSVSSFSVAMYNSCTGNNEIGQTKVKKPKLVQ